MMSNKILIYLSIMFLLFTIAGCSNQKYDLIRGENFNYATNQNELIDYVLKNKYLVEVNNIITTPTYQRPVYNVLYGKDEKAEEKILVLFVEKPNSAIRVLDSFYEKDIFSKDDVKQYLLKKGFNISNLDDRITLTPYMEYILTWDVQWESDNENGRHVFYRYKFDIKTGKVVEEYICPSQR